MVVGLALHFVFMGVLVNAFVASRLPSQLSRRSTLVVRGCAWFDCSFRSCSDAGVFAHLCDSRYISKFPGTPSWMFLFRIIDVVATASRNVTTRSASTWSTQTLRRWVASVARSATLALQQAAENLTVTLRLRGALTVQYRVGRFELTLVINQVFVNSVSVCEAPPVHM